MKTTITAVALVGLSTGASAQTITHYDITDAVTSGFGLWSHVYDGTISPTGAGESVNGFTYTRANYTGGSGTLNDGVLGSDTNDTQLFVNNDTVDPTISLHLDQAYFIESIELFSFDRSSNSIPGRIASFDVTINGVTESFNSVENTIDDEFISLLGSSLESEGASMVILSNFIHDGGNNIEDQFAIGEIVIFGEVVPVPASLSLLGVASVAMARRRR